MSNAALVAAGSSSCRNRGFLRRYVRDVLASRKHLAQGLERLGVKVFPSGANFLLVDFGPGGSETGAPLGLRRGILLRDRAGEMGRDGFVRVTAGTMPQTRRLLRAIARGTGETFSCLIW